MAVKHKWLPQITADYDYLINELDNNAVGYKLDKFKPADLTPLSDNVNINNVQGIRDSILDAKPVTPIIISKDNEVLDGHDRLQSFKMTPEVQEIFCIKLYCDKHDASRILNKIQDKFNWENQLDDNFEVKKDVDEEQNETPKNSQTLCLFSNKPLTKNTNIGNFLSNKENQSFKHKYEIGFDNLYEMSDEECGNNPLESLGKKWFSENYDSFKMEAAKSVLTFEKYLMKKIHREALDKGYDGIKYGTKFVQTIDKHE